MESAMFIVTCHISGEACAKLEKLGTVPTGITWIFKTRAPAVRCATEWVAAGLGPAEVNGRGV